MYFQSFPGETLQAAAIRAQVMAQNDVFAAIAARDAAQTVPAWCPPLTTGLAECERIRPGVDEDVALLLLL